MAGMTGSAPVGAILQPVGFDPNRKYNATTFDYALVVICIAVALGLVVWAFAG